MKAWTNKGSQAGVLASDGSPNRAWTRNGSLLRVRTTAVESEADLSRAGLMRW